MIRVPATVATSALLAAALLAAANGPPAAWDGRAAPTRSAASPAAAWDGRTAPTRSAASPAAAWDGRTAPTPAAAPPVASGTPAAAPAIRQAAATPTPTATAPTPTLTPTAPATASPSPSGTPPARRPAGPQIPVPVATAPGPSRGCPPTQAVSRVTRQPWAQRVLGLSGAWRITRGRHVTVAVVDSGVDGSPQLAGRVSAIDLTGTGYSDCVGHGTAVAAIIAASDRLAHGQLFAGVAPDARILSVKFSNSDKGTSATLAQGIRDAALLGARVINVSVTTGDSAALRAAVRYALAHNAVVVAAGGNDGQGGGVKGPFYPASYPGVISVGAVTRSGALASFSDRLSHVAVTAPGTSITSAWPGGYQTGLSGTSFATAFVSGVAALVRSRYPHLTVAGVVRRIEVTADGATARGAGNGLAQPLAAVSDLLPPPAPAGGTVTPAPVAVATAPPPRRSPAAALAVTAALLAAAALVALGTMVAAAGRRRRWRAGRGTP
jgi:membrane-anchored mycosin MYCP